MNPKSHHLVVKPHPDDEAEVYAAFENEDSGMIVTSAQLDRWAETGEVPWQESSGSSRTS